MFVNDYNYVCLLQGVATIPCSAFYGEHKSLGEKYIRFCFIKVCKGKQKHIQMDISDFFQNI